MIRLDSLRVKLNHLETKNADNEANIILLETKDAEKNIEKIALLEEKNAAQEEEISNWRPRLMPNWNPIILIQPTIKKLVHFIENQILLAFLRQEQLDSLLDLSLIGHNLDGYYLVQNPKKMETIYCTFGTSGKFKRIA